MKDFSELNRKVKNLFTNFKDIAGDYAYRFGLTAVQHSRKKYLRGQVLNVRSGKLFNSIDAKKHNVGNDVGVIVGSIMDGGVIYSRIHEYGGVITPKTKKALAFKIKVGNEKKLIITKKVTMPKRPYISPAIADKVEDGTAKKLLVGIVKERWDHL